MVTLSARRAPSPARKGSNSVTSGQHQHIRRSPQFGSLSVSRGSCSSCRPAASTIRRAWPAVTTLRLELARDSRSLTTTHRDRMRHAHQKYSQIFAAVPCLHDADLPWSTMVVRLRDRASGAEFGDRFGKPRNVCRHAPENDRDYDRASTAGLSVTSRGNDARCTQSVWTTSLRYN